MSFKERTTVETYSMLISVETFLRKWYLSWNVKHEKEATRLIVLGEGCYIGKGQRTCKNLHIGKSLGLSNDLKEGCLSIIGFPAGTQISSCLCSWPWYAYVTGTWFLQAVSSCLVRWLCWTEPTEGTGEGLEGGQMSKARICLPLFCMAQESFSSNGEMFSVALASLALGKTWW